MTKAICPICGKPCQASKVALGGSVFAMRGCTCVADRAMMASIASAAPDSAYAFREHRT